MPVCVCVSICVGVDIYIAHSYETIILLLLVQEQDHHFQRSIFPLHLLYCCYLKLHILCISCSMMHWNEKVTYYPQKVHICTHVCMYTCLWSVIFLPPFTHSLTEIPQWPSVIVCRLVACLSLLPALTDLDYFLPSTYRSHASILRYPVCQPTQLLNSPGWYFSSSSAAIAIIKQKLLFRWFSAFHCNICSSWYICTYVCTYDVGFKAKAVCLALQFITISE